MITADSGSEFTQHEDIVPVLAFDIAAANDLDIDAGGRYSARGSASLASDDAKKGSKRNLSSLRLPELEIANASAIRAPHALIHKPYFS